MRTKSLLFILMVLFLTAGLMGQEPAPTAQSIMDAAYKKATLENKKVFLMFHASWCGWCHRMDSLMTKTDCKSLFEDNFVIEHLVVQESAKKKNLENPGAQEMLVKYKGDKSGIPYWLVFNSKGKLLADSRMKTKSKEGKTVLANTGCPATEEEVAYFRSVLDKTTKLTAQDLDLIAERFIIRKQ